MTIHEDSLIVAANVTFNKAELMKARGLASVLTGVVAGILNIEGYIAGGSFFVIAMLFSSVVLILSLPKDLEPFPPSFNIYTHGLGSGLMGFVLCWVLSFNLCHIF